jgi:hypothetical protein
MSTKDLDNERRRFLHERGPVSELELVEWEVEGLTPQERMSLERRRLFLRAFAVRGVVTEGLRAAGVSRSAVEHWRETSEWFEELYLTAIEEAADRIEAEAFRRAVDGYDEPVIYQGMMTTVLDEASGEPRALTVRKYSDALLQTLLRGARPEKYRESHRVEVSAAAGGVLVVPAPIDAATWAAEARSQQARYAGNEGSAPSKPAAD